MSGACTGWVLRHGPSDHAMRAVLVVLADAANGDGEHAYPGVDSIVDWSGYSRGWVFAALRRLVDEGWIEVELEGGGRGRPTVYRVLMGAHPGSEKRSALPDPKPKEKGLARRDKGSSPHPEKGLVHDVKGLVHENAPSSRTLGTTTKQRPERAGAARMREDWRPDDDLRAWASKNTPTVNVDFEAEKFVDYWLSKGTTRADWSAGFRNWLRNASTFAGPGRAPSNGHRHRPIDNDRDAPGGLLDLSDPAHPDGKIVR